MELEDELKNIKDEMKKLEKELKTKKSSNDRELEDLEKALKKAIENWKYGKKDETPEAIKPKKKLNWRKGFSVALMVSRIVVFASFMYTALILYNLDKVAEALIIIVAVSLYLIMNKLEGG